MKIKNIIIAAIASVLTLSSCSGYLDEDPKGQLSSASFFSTQDELNMATYALYRTVCQTSMNTHSAGVNWQGDDLTTNPGSNKQSWAQIDAFHPSDANEIISSYVWPQWYTVIKAANYIILNAESTPTTEEEINIAIGNAKAWRAVAYFTLVRAFGPVPLNLDGEVNYDRPLASVAEVYAQIEQDLRDAINILPTDYSSEPRKVNGANAYVTKQSAQCILVAVLMAEAGWPLNDTSKFTEAASIAKSVIDGVNNGQYEYILESDYANVYAPSHNYTNETVLGVNHGHAGTWAEDCQMSSSNFYESLGGWGDGWGEIQFWKDFPEGARKDATYNKKILYNNGRTVDGDANNGKLMDWWEKCAPGYTEYHPMFRVFTVGENSTDYDYTKPASTQMCTDMRVRLIRYSEVLLWYAECQARSTGTPSADAYEALNRVRVRAGEEPVSGLSAADFEDLCVKEHGWEIAGNWCALVARRDDQLRMNTLEETFNRRKANAAIEVAPGVTMQEQVEVPASTTWQGESSIYMPYPSLDASLNPNLHR